MARKPTPIHKLLAAMDRCAVSRGEMMYTMGYRARREISERLHDDPEAQRLRVKQDVQMAASVLTENNFRRLATRLLREARRESPTAKRRKKSVRRRAPHRGEAR